METPNDLSSMAAADQELVLQKASRRRAGGTSNDVQSIHGHAGEGEYQIERGNAIVSGALRTCFIQESRHVGSTNGIE